MRLQALAATAVCGLLAAGCLNMSGWLGHSAKRPAGYRKCSRRELRTDTFRSACAYRAANGSWRVVQVSPAVRPSSATVKGRVVTTACGGLVVRTNCPPTAYRGWLVFCQTMNEKGFCPGARVDAEGHYEVTLPRGGRYAVIPAPGRGNVVDVKPRWVVLTRGRTTVLNINAGNLKTKEAAARARSLRRSRAPATRT